MRSPEEMKARQERDVIQVEIAALQKRARDLGLPETAARLARATRGRCSYEKPGQVPPNPYTVGLAPLERTILLAFRRHGNPEWGYSFKWISKMSGVPLHQVKRPVRGLARKGLVRLERLFSEDDGLTAGSGYMMTAGGEARADQERK